METSERGLFEGFMDTLAQAFTISDARLEKVKATYFDYLEDIDLARLDKGVQEAIRTLDTFPTINKLRTLSRAHDGGLVCRECSRRPTEDHIRDIAAREYEISGRSIDWTLERVYQHAQTTYLKNPEIRLWAKRAIMEAEGCSSLPVRLQTEEQRAKIEAVLREKGYDSDQRPDLRHRAKVLAQRAPWMEDEVHEMLLEHQRYYAGRFEDMKTMAASHSVPDSMLTQAAILSTEQILEAGQALYKKINGIISRAILAQDRPVERDENGKRKWTDEQRKEGQAKLRALRTDRPDVDNARISRQDSPRIDLNGKLMPN